jgi:hypothetical protein
VEALEYTLLMLMPPVNATRPSTMTIFRHRVELQHLHTRRAQAVEEGDRCVERARAVVDQGDRHTLPAFCDEQIAEAAAHFIVFDDVELGVDVVAGVLHRLEHRPVTRRAVVEQRDVIARGERRPGELFLDRNVAREQVAALALRL